jgi:hypothetical protein
MAKAGRHERGRLGEVRFIRTPPIRQAAPPKSECAVKASWRNVASPERMQVRSEPLE